MLHVTLTRTSDLDAVGREWLEFERHADLSFFQSWSWIGCLAQERFDQAVLLEARDGGLLVGLALLNRRPGRFPGVRRLWLAESGRPALDAVFTEHNGLLVARGRQDVLAACLKTLLATGDAVRLSGVNAAHLRAAEQAGAVIASCQVRTAPFIDLGALRLAGRAYLDALSANARYQLRRSAKGYAARGTLRVERADTLAAAHAYFDALGRLHQATWTRRGRSGAFANPAFVRFHRALIDRSHAAGGIDLLRITAAEQVIGYLYNFRHGGRVSAYQSGFDYGGDGDGGSHLKPGLTCHHLAIEHYLTAGTVIYDFLAGDDRYKTSLCPEVEALYWVDAVRPLSLLGAGATLRSRVDGLASWRLLSRAFTAARTRPQARR